MNRTTGRILAHQSSRARTLPARFRGWMLQEPPEDAALCVERCDWVHTFLLRFTLDIAYCDRAGAVLHIVTLRPNRFGPRVRGAADVWEMRAGALAPHAAPGDILSDMLSDLPSIAPVEGSAR